jgi:hypothetical protein
MDGVRRPIGVEHARRDRPTKPAKLVPRRQPEREPQTPKETVKTADGAFAMVESRRKNHPKSESMAMIIPTTRDISKLFVE